jgi:hypothetical protein
LLSCLVFQARYPLPRWMHVREFLTVSYIITTVPPTLFPNHMYCWNFHYIMYYKISKKIQTIPVYNLKFKH